MLKFRFTVEEANLILEALGEVPAKRSMSVIQKIHNQAQNEQGVQASESNKGNKSEEPKIVAGEANESAKPNATKKK